jgi:hypothetical protein
MELIGILLIWSQTTISEDLGESFYVVSLEKAENQGPDLQIDSNNVLCEDCRTCTQLALSFGPTGNLQSPSSLELI